VSSERMRFTVEIDAGEVDAFEEAAMAAAALGAALARFENALDRLRSMNVVPAEQGQAGDDPDGRRFAR
jgi:hypothetical protein